MKFYSFEFAELVLALAVLSIFSSCVSGQKNLVSKDEVSVRFEYVAKRGNTNVYSVDRTKIPNAPKLPNSYQPLGAKGYLISTDVIDLGYPTAFFKVPVKTAEEFEKVSVLRLAVNDIAPEGYEWQDCTSSIEVARGQMHPKMLEERKDFDEWYTARMNKLLPDFTSRIVTCKPDEKLKEDEYFILATRTAAPPSQPFTNLKFAVVNENQPNAQEPVYRISFKNAGQTDIANLSIFSVFDIDTHVKKVVPTQGACLSPPRDTSGRMTICQLGRVSAGAEVSIEFVGSDSGMSRTVKKGTLNFGWDIDAFSVKNPGDPLWWGANRAEFQPLAESN